MRGECPPRSKATAIRLSGQQWRGSLLHSPASKCESLTAAIGEGANGEDRIIGSNTNPQHALATAVRVRPTTFTVLLRNGVP